MVIEPATQQSAFDPDDRRFTQLSEGLLRAFHVGWHRRRADPKVGLRAPGLLLDAGLAYLRAEAIAQVHLLADARRPKKDVFDQLAVEAFELPPPTREFLRVGGFSLKEQRETQLAAVARLSRLRDNPALISRSGYIRLASTQVIAAGRRA